MKEKVIKLSIFVIFMFVMFSSHIHNINADVKIKEDNIQLLENTGNKLNAIKAKGTRAIAVVESEVDGNTSVSNWKFDAPVEKIVNTTVKIPASVNKAKLTVKVPFELEVTTYDSKNTPIIGEYLDDVTITKATQVGENTILEYKFKPNTNGEVTVKYSINPDGRHIAPTEDFNIEAVLDTDGTVANAPTLKIGVIHPVTLTSYFKYHGITDDKVYPGMIFEGRFSTQHSPLGVDSYLMGDRVLTIPLPKGVELINNSDPNITFDNSDLNNPKVIIKNFPYTSAVSTLKLRLSDNATVGDILSSAEQRSYDYNQAYKVPVSNKFDMPTLQVVAPYFDFYTEINPLSVVVNQEKQHLAIWRFQNTTGADLNNAKIKVSIPDGLKPTAFRFNSFKGNFPVILEYTTKNGLNKSITISSNSQVITPSQLGIIGADYLKSITLKFNKLDTLDGVNEVNSAPLAATANIHFFGNTSKTFEDGSVIKKGDTGVWKQEISSDEISTPIKKDNTFKYTTDSRVPVDLIGESITGYKSFFYANDRFNMLFRVAPSIYPYANSSQWVNPEWNIRIPDGFIPDLSYLSSYTVKGAKPTITTRVDSTGATIINFKFSGNPGDSSYLVLNSWDENFKETEDGKIRFSIPVTVSETAPEDTWNFLNDEIVISSPKVTSTPNQELNTSYYGTETRDLKDINGDGSTNDRVLIVNNNSSVNYKNITVQYPKAFISSSAAKSDIDANWRTYNSAAVDVTTSEYLPKTNGQYRFTIYNGTVNPYYNGVVYIPLPKLDDSLGSEWQPLLQGPATLSATTTATISYSTATNPDQNELTGGSDTGYSATVSDYSKVTMVKIKIDNIPSGKDKHEVFLPLKTSTIIKQNQTSNMAYIQAKYTYEDATGTKYGPSTSSIAAFKLKPITISGYAFEDTDFNSQSNESKYLENVKVSLIDKSSGSIISTTKTDTLGKYSFSVPNGLEGSSFADKYEVKFDAPAGYIVANKGTTDNSSKININTLKSDDLVLQNDNHININAGFGPDAIITLNPASHDMLVGDTASSTYSITNGSFSKATLSNTSAFTMTQGLNSLTFVANQKGAGNVTLEFLDGYNRKRTDLNKNIALNSGIDASKFTGQIEFVDNKGQVVHVDKKYIENIKVELLDNSNNVLASTISDNEGKYKIENIEILAGDYTLRYTIPTGNNVKIVESKNPQTEASNDILLNGLTQGSNKVVNVKVSDLDNPNADISLNSDALDYNPTTITKVINDKTTEAILKYTLYKDGKVYKSDNDGEFAIPNEDGIYQLKYYAIDLAKNTSKEEVIDFKIDKTPPTGKIIIKNKTNPKISDIKIKVKDNIDKNPKVTWILKGPKNKVITSGTSTKFKYDKFNDLAPGKYQIILVSKDEAGNISKDVIETFIISKDKNPLPKTGQTSYFVMLVVLGVCLGIIRFKKQD